MFQLAVIVIVIHRSVAESMQVCHTRSFPVTLKKPVSVSGSSRNCHQLDMLKSVPVDRFTGHPDILGQLNASVVAYAPAEPLGCSFEPNRGSRLNGHTD